MERGQGCQANLVVVKWQMGYNFSEQSHRWFSRWILLGSYCLGADFSCWLWQAGQLQQREDPYFALLNACAVLKKTGSAGTVSATILVSLCTLYMPLWFSFSSVSFRKGKVCCKQIYHLISSSQGNWQMLLYGKQSPLQIVMIYFHTHTHKKKIFLLDRYVFLCLFCFVNFDGM